MKNMKYIAGLMLSLAFCAAACSDDDAEEAMYGVVSADVEFDAAGGSGTIVFRPEGVTQVTSDRDWLVPAAPGTGSVAFTVAANGEMMSRSANVTLHWGGATQTVAVTQMGSILDAEACYEVGPLPKSTAFDLYAQGNVTVSAADSWASVRIENGQLVVTPEVNPGEARTTTLTIRSGWKSMEVTLRQRSFKAFEQVRLEQPGEAVAFPMDEEIAELDASWSVEPEAEWLHAARDGATLVVSADPNETKKPLSSTVTVHAGGLTFDVPVWQSSISDYYEYFAGDWTLHYADGTLAVSLETLDDRSGYNLIIEGLRYQVGYDEETHQMSLTTHYMGYRMSMSGTIYYLHMCPTSSTGGRTWAPGAGFDMIFNGDEENNSIAFVDNGGWEGTAITSIGVFLFTSTTASSSSWGGYYYVRYFNVTEMTR